MAEISMIQMTGPAVSPGASAEKTQGGQVMDFSELLRDKGQSVSDSGKKTEVKKSEKEQEQTPKPDYKVTAQKDEKQEADESASSSESTEEGLSVLAGMMLQAQTENAVMAEVPEAAAEAGQIETVLSVEESAGPVQMPSAQVQAAEVETAPPVQEAAQAAQPQNTVQEPLKAAAREPEPEPQPQAENHADQSQTSVVQAHEPEQPRQENQAAAQEQTEMGTEASKEGETAVRPEEQTGAQQAASGQFRSQMPAEGENIPSETGTVKTSEAAMYRDIAETLASRMPTEDGTLTLELEPASLGKIIIKVAFEGGKAVMSLMADNTKTLAILSQRAGEMAQILEEKTGQQTVIYTPENQPSQQELPEKGGEENRQRQRDAQEEKSHDKESESFMQQLRLGLVG